LTSLQQRLVKTGGRLVTHARYYWLLLTESCCGGRLEAKKRRKTGEVLTPAPRSAGRVHETHQFSTRTNVDATYRTRRSGL